MPQNLAITAIFWHVLRTDAVLPTRAPALTNTQLRCDMADLSHVLKDATFQERFWSKVDRRGPHECWHWSKRTDPCGYGRVRAGKYAGALAHRIALVLKLQRDIPGEYACHTCDTPSCVNPQHLYAGTAQDNALDRENRKAPNIKRRSYNSPMTAEKAQSILLQKGRSSAVLVARENHISPRTVRDIWYGRTWKALSDRAAALSDLIAGDADLIAPDTLADSDGDDGA